MQTEQENLKRLAFAIGGGAIGALLVKNHFDDAKMSRVERNDPDGVEWLCGLIGNLLDEWRPRSYATENGYTEAMFRHLNRRLPD